MILPTHISGGYLALNIVNKINPNLGLSTNGLMIAGLVGSVLPDIDFVFFKYVKDHHNSWPHAPLFWIAIYLLIITLGFILKNQIIKGYSTALIIGILIHLSLDWFSGRTAGIRIFYPFSEQVFSLYPLNPQKGEVPTSIFPNKEYVEFFKFYAQNKFLLFSEIGLTISGLFLFIFNLLKSKIL